MPLLDQLAKRAADRLPSVVGPRTHSIAHYAIAGTFAAFGVAAWRRNQRAAISAFGCALFLTTTGVLTDCPGGLVRELPFAAHGRMDIGLAALAAALPGFMGFEKQSEARFFHVQAAVLGGLAGLTDFLGTRERRQLRHLERAA